MFVTLRRYADEKDDDSGLDPSTAFAPLMNLQQCRGIEATAKSPRKNGSPSRMRAASLVGTNFAYENIIAVEKEDIIEPHKFGLRRKSGVSMSEEEISNERSLKRSQVNLNMDENGLQLFENAGRNPRISDSQHASMEDGSGLRHMQSVVEVGDMNVVRETHIGIASQD